MKVQRKKYPFEGLWTKSVHEGVYDGNKTEKGKWKALSD